MRTWFRWSPPFRAVRGGVILEIQHALAKAGHLASVDGVFANQTKLALKAWQAAKGLATTGEVDELTLAGLIDVAKPQLFRRCLAVTAAFEGHGYTFAAGNWDNAYLTWGIVGFTLKAGNMGKVITRVNTRHPALLTEAMGAEKAAELLAILTASAAKKREWADGISVLPKKYRVRADWEDAFEALGNRKEVRAIQDEVAREVYWAQAVKDLKKYGQLTELDAAMFFETAVQNGSVDGAKGTAIEKALADNPGVPNRARLALIAEAIASNSLPDFQVDVRSRRMTVATGQGTVHGATYQIVDWGLDDKPIEEIELA